MVLRAEGSPLVAGSSSDEGPQVVRVEVVKAFCLRAIRQEPGAVIEVAAHIARELIAYGKARAATAQPPPAENPQSNTTDEGSQPAEPSPKKGKSNARK